MPRAERPTRAVMADLVRATGGNVSQLARRIGITRQTCYTWIYQLDLAPLVGIRQSDREEPMEEETEARDAAQPGRVTATIKVDGELWKAVRIAGVKEDRTASAIVEEALRAYLDGGQA